MVDDTRCTLDGCDKPKRGRGWCGMHYQRWQAHGDPLKGTTRISYGSDAVCAVEGCDRIGGLSRGWCTKHYQRWLNNGDPESTQTPDMILGSAEERFWPKVDASGPCWEWTKGRNPDGYGMFRYKGKMRGAHQVSWEMLVGPVPEGLELDHLCKNRACVCPEHLEPVTHVENVRRGNAVAVFRSRTVKATHCIRNHEYNDENTRYTKTDSGITHRKCRVCDRERQQESKERKRQAKSKA